jgi:hypothetical protein
MAKKPAPLSLVPPTGTVVTLPEPPLSLGEAGLSLWRSVQAQYGVSDSGGLAILQAACEAADRVAEISAIINAQGLMIPGKGGPREHPLLKHEVANRALLGRLISRLGLDVEVLRPTPGRPTSPLGWIPPSR